MNTQPIQVKSYAAFDTTAQLKPYTIERRALESEDVQIEILYCGICHSDLHTINGDWGNKNYPLVPGHEIVGRVEAVGANVKKYKLGDKVGVGCFVTSCQTCSACQSHLEQYCEKGATFTYGSTDHQGKITQGGYSAKIVVTEKYVLSIPENLPLDAAAPLLCAGITTYSPLKKWGAGPKTKVAIAGLGGLGHMGVKLAKAMGCEVTVLSTSESKVNDALKLGAHDVIVTKNSDQLIKNKNRFDLILNTISAPHSYDAYLGLLKLDGAMVLLGLPPGQNISAGSLITKRRSLAGSLIGGIKETQEMLDFCGKHEITSDIELIPIQKINEAYIRMVKNDVKYRFVIDMKSLT